MSRSNSPHPAAKPAADATALITRARQVLQIEASAIHTLAQRIDTHFVRAIELILACPSRVVVSGIGKSGHIARKIASTFASTGTPALFVHPAEACHGDLGMIVASDVFIALSYSGTSEELLAIVPLLKRRGTTLIVISGEPNAPLALEADVFLNAQVDQEACPHNLAPTASTTAALALGDALAVALLEARGFSADDFARSHPGGALGRRLLLRVSDVMRTGEAIPRVLHNANLREALIEITRKGLGMTAILDAQDRVVGIYTDGDLRRTLDRRDDPRETPITALMSANPRSIRPDALAVDAAQLMETHRITQLLVIDAQNQLVGALNTHDLLHHKVI